MTRTFTCGLGLMFILGLSQPTGWHGVVPLHSTMSDVVRLLGTSSDSNESRARYHFPNEDVYIVFANKDICGDMPASVPAGTVLMIEVTPNKETELQALKVDTTTFRRFDPSTPQNIGYEAYINEEEGMMIRVYKGLVDKQFYFAAAKDRGTCPGYYDHPEKFANILLESLPRKFDKYSDLPLEDEKARLDNFAIYLQKDEPQLKGYVIVYAGQNMRSGEAQRRAKRAKDYLVKVRGIEAARIVTIDGGCRDQFEVELYALPSSVLPPTPNPHRNE